MQPPVSSQGILDGLAMAREDLRAVIGIYDAGLGRPSNETSGKAILARQREGDVGSYLYIDNFARAVRQTGNIINDKQGLSKKLAVSSHLFLMPRCTLIFSSLMKRQNGRCTGCAGRFTTGPMPFQAAPGISFHAPDLKQIRAHNAYRRARPFALSMS